MPSDELSAYLGELAEMAGYAGVGVITSSELKGPIPIRDAKLIYAFFHDMVHWAADARSESLFAHMRAVGGRLAVRLLPSADARGYRPDAALSEAVGAAGGTVGFIDYDDAYGICLTLPEGGDGGH